MWAGMNRSALHFAVMGAHGDHEEGGAGTPPPQAALSEHTAAYIYSANTTHLSRGRRCQQPPPKAALNEHTAYVYAIYVYICVLVLLYMCPHTAVCVLS